MNTEKKVIYLTFDDGPDCRYTERLLNLLRQYGIHASFFVVASCARKNPGIMEKMKEDGHLIGLHSLEHRDAYFQTPGYIKKDFAASICLLGRLGIRPGFYRPPWGHQTGTVRREAEQYGLRTVLWDVMAQDWRARTSAGEIVKKLKSRVYDGAVVCLHDGRGRNGAPERTLLALRVMIPYWIECGYTFATVDQL